MEGVAQYVWKWYKQEKIEKGRDGKEQDWERVRKWRRKKLGAEGIMRGETAKMDTKSTKLEVDRRSGHPLGHQDSSFPDAMDRSPSILSFLLLKSLTLKNSGGLQRERDEHFHCRVQKNIKAHIICRNIKNGAEQERDDFKSAIHVFPDSQLP